MKRIFWLSLVALLIVIDCRQHYQLTHLPKVEAIKCPPPQIITKVMTDEEYIKTLPHGQLVWQTYGHESTFGLHDGCKAQGKYNGFGFAQNAHGYACFDTLEEVAGKVSDWFETQLQIKSVRNALCYYQSGHKDQLDCDYANYSLNIK